MTEGMYPILRIPVSTYRLQFNRHFRFTDAKKIVQYLHDLGITDIYSSPYLKAKEGSLHGYDIVDHHALNPDVGTEEEYDGLVSALRKHDMGQILDIVPNHMEIASKENLWWIDVLENGLSSVYEKFFDIDWHPVKKELTNKLLLPILGDQYGNILENQELILTFEEGAFYINYYEHMFPIRPQTYSYILRHRLKELETRLTSENPHVMELLSIITALDHLPPYTELNEEKVKERYREKEVIKKRLLNLYAESTEIKEFIDQNINIFHGSKGDSKSFDLLDNLLDSQVYRLSYWRVATEEINYRRFFDISNLAAIRVENPEVFKETHSLVFRLIRENKVTGLRVDHPDGLYNPSEYFQRLQGNCLAQSQPENKTEDSEKPAALSVQDVTGQNTLIQHNKELPAPGIQSKQFYIVGEKILALTEKIPEDWPIYSTTGYEFLNLLNGIFVETRNAKKFDRIYTSFIKTKLQFHAIFHAIRIIKPVPMKRKN